MSSQCAAQGGSVQSQTITPFPAGSRSNVVSLAVTRWISNLSVTFPQTAHEYCPETIKPARNALNHNEGPVTNTAFNYEVFMTCSWISRVKKEIEWNRTDVEITQMLLRWLNIIADQLQPLMHCQTINIIWEQLKKYRKELEDLIWTAKYFKSQTNSAITRRDWLTTQYTHGHTHRQTPLQPTPTEGLSEVFKPLLSTKKTVIWIWKIS